MRFVIYLLLALAVLVHAQKKDEKKTVSGINKGNKDDSRSFFTTAWTLLKYTTTSTSIFTSTTTCTTSTASLTTCTAGRRRRGLFYDDGEAVGKNRRALFYNEDENKKEEGNAFLVKSPSDDPVDEVQSVKKDDGSNLIPLEIESGYKLPDNLNANRFFFNIGTSTVTSVSISTTTLSITATCSSVTNFATCGASGK